jgi:hypothetical protein
VQAEQAPHPADDYHAHTASHKQERLIVWRLGWNAKGDVTHYQNDKKQYEKQIFQQVGQVGGYGMQVVVHKNPLLHAMQEKNAIKQYRNGIYH